MMFIMQVSISRARKSEPETIPAIDRVTYTGGGAEVVFESLPEVAIDKTVRTNAYITANQKAMLGSLYYDEKELGQLQSMLSTELVRTHLTNSINNSSGQFLSITFPQATLEDIQFTERPFIPRAISLSDPSEYDAGLLSAAEQVCVGVEQKLLQSGITESFITLAIRIPVESMAAREENERIRDGLGHVISESLGARGIRASVRVSLVEMTCAHLGTQVNESNWRDIRTAIMADAVDEYGEKIPPLWANSAGELTHALEELGEQKIFFPNHKNFPVLRSCYNTLRYVGISQNYQIQLDPQSGYLRMEVGEHLSQQQLAEVAQKLEKYGFYIEHADSDGQKQLIRCQLIKDDEPVRGGEGLLTLLVVGENDYSPINFYSLMKKRGESINIKIKANERRENRETIFKLVKLDVPAPQEDKPKQITRKKQVETEIVVKREDIIQKKQIETEIVVKSEEKIDLSLLYKKQEKLEKELKDSKEASRKWRLKVFCSNCTNLNLEMSSDGMVDASGRPFGITNENFAHMEPVLRKYVQEGSKFFIWANEPLSVASLDHAKRLGIVPNDSMPGKYTRWSDKVVPLDLDFMKQSILATEANVKYRQKELDLHNAKIEYYETLYDKGGKETK